MNLRWALPVVILFLARSVHAAEPLDEATVVSSAPEHRHWYGWQTALVDFAALSLGATVSGISGVSGKSHTDREAANIVGALTITTFVLGGPAVHAAHKRWEKAGASLALRLGAPTGGALGGFLAGTVACPHDDRDVPCSVIGAVFGLVAGAATASILDATVIAYEPAPERALSVRVVPLLIAERDRWEAGLGGTF